MDLTGISDHRRELQIAAGRHGGTGGVTEQIGAALRQLYSDVVRLQVNAAAIPKLPKQRDVGGVVLALVVELILGVGPGTGSRGALRSLRADRPLRAALPGRTLRTHGALHALRAHRTFRPLRAGEAHFPGGTKMCIRDKPWSRRPAINSGNASTVVCLPDESCSSTMPRITPSAPERILSEICAAGTAAVAASPAARFRSK